MNKLSFFAMTLIFVLMTGGTALGQTLYDSFSDGDFTAAPVWGGTTVNWTVVTDSSAAAGATGSNTVRLAAPTGSAGIDYLSSQISTFGMNQEWGVFIGRRAQAFTAGNQQYFWLYATEADLTSATVDGYRIAIGDDSGGDEIRLQYIVDGAVSATVITSSEAIPNSLIDIGLLIRVTRSSTGVFQLYTSTLPTANGEGAIATDIPNATNASVNQGMGTNNSLVLMANGYIGLAALHTSGTDPRVAAEFDQVYFTPDGTTAAGAMINGRITDSRGRGLQRVVVMMTGGGIEEPIYATTSAFGYYRFEDIPAGNTYILTASSIRYTFEQATIVINVGGDFSGADFIGQNRFIKLTDLRSVTKLK